MKRLALLAALLVFAVPATATTPDDCATDVLPDGPKDCVYRHVPFAAFDYSAGRLRVDWPEDYTLDEVYLAKDWKKAFPYRPGAAAQIAFDADSRYDVVARFTDRRTGETFLGLTPIACRSRLDHAGGFMVVPAPVQGCATETPLECQVRSKVDCKDRDGNTTGTVSVECSGDSGTCSDKCSNDERACCTATEETTTTSSNGTETQVTAVEQNTQRCSN